MHGMSCHWSSALTVRPPEKPVAFAPLTFTCSSTCLRYRPLAISCAPFLDIARSSRSPLLSMNVTSLRSITQARLSWLLCALFQAVLSSLTDGPTKRPCTIHLLSVSVSVMVILSTSTSQACPAHASACRQRERLAECCSMGRAALFLGCVLAPSAYEPQCLQAQTKLRPSLTSLGGCRDRAPPPTFRPPTDQEPFLDQTLARGP